MTLREFAARVRGALGFGPPDADLARELDFHRVMLEARHRERGLDPAAARRAARIELGGDTQIAETWRDQGRLPFLDTLGQDVRYALRLLRRSPGFAATAIATLALGIGACTAIFTVIDTVLLRPLPFTDSARLVTVGDRNPDGSSATAGFQTMTAWRDRSRTLEGFAGMRPWTPTLVTGAEAERIQAVRVSWNYFDLLGVRPSIGRTFTTDDEGAGEWPPYAIVSDSLWRRRLGGDPSIVGRTVSLSDRAYRIVGVMPASFEPLDSETFYNARAELWAPIGSYMKGTAASGNCRGCAPLKVLARLGPGATIATATSEMNAIREQLRRENPGDYETGSMAVVPLQRALTSDVRPALLVLMGAVLFVLLIACANVASLLLARSVTRQRELTLRAALGAGRARLVRQLLTESLLLAGIGGIAGVVVAAIGVRGLAALAPATLPRLDHAGVDARILAFTALVTLATSVTCGLWPAWRSADRRGGRSLALDTRGAVGHRSRARALLVIADLTLALALLAGAGLMLRTLAALTHEKPGFSADGVLTMRFALTGRAYSSDEASIAFQQRLLERLRALPAVQDVAVAGSVPFTGGDGCWGFHARGRMEPNPADDPCVERYSFSGDYFRVMDIPVIAGSIVYRGGQRLCQSGDPGLGIDGQAYLGFREPYRRAGANRRHRHMADGRRRRWRRASQRSNGAAGAGDVYARNAAHERIPDARREGAKRRRARARSGCASGDSRARSPRPCLCRRAALQPRPPVGRAARVRDARALGLRDRRRAPGGPGFVRPRRVQRR